MSNVMTANEKAYADRYGTSLNELWNRLSKEKQEQYLNEACKQTGDKISGEYRFTSDEILRIVIGYINSEQLEGILDNSTQVTSILIWEPDEIRFIAASILEDISRFISDNRFNFVLGRDRKRLEQALHITVRDYNLMHRHIYAYGEYLHSDNADTEEFIKIFREFYIDMASKMNFRKLYEYVMYENVLYAINILNNNSTVNQLYENVSTRNIPVIIVAAGPSLMKNCAELRRAKGKAIIVAVAHSMKTLNNNGIKPDVVAVMDPVTPFFLDYDDKREYTLLCCVYSKEDFLKYYNGKVIFYGFPMYRDLFSLPRTDGEVAAELDTGSVATDVFSLFVAAGFKRFILVGQDLSFDEEGMSHTGRQQEKLEKYENGIFPEAEGIYGGMVKTRDDWELFRNYYERRILNDQSLSVIDATEGGALIHGSRVMKLSDAIDEYCSREYPVDEWINSIPKGDGKEKKQIDEWFEQLVDMNQRISVSLDRIIELNEDITRIIHCLQPWDDDFASKCKRYDIIYHIIMEGDDGMHIREYCRADIERYIEDALSLEGDENIGRRMNRELELFIIMRDKLVVLQEYVKSIRG